MLFRHLVPIKRTNVVCGGDESSLSECVFDGPEGDETCEHEDDIIIICKGEGFSLTLMSLAYCDAIFSPRMQ